MTDSHPRKLGLWAAMIVLIVSGGAFAMGFYVLPASQGATTLWQRICRGAGVSRTDKDIAGATALPGYTVVVMPRAAMTPGTTEQIGHGATLALRCTACHGAAGMSGANAPNLAGQSSDVIYKELLDFQNGARSDAAMGAMVLTLSQDNMLDLAHYYAALPRVAADLSPATAPALVRVGDPMRGIAPCASCHANHGMVGAPYLNGEPRAYLEAQLTEFADGQRRNDRNAVMRGEARRLTANEMSILAAHYAALSPARGM